MQNILVKSKVDADQGLVVKEAAEEEEDVENLDVAGAEAVSSDASIIKLAKSKLLLNNSPSLTNFQNEKCQCWLGSQHKFKFDKSQVI